MIYANVTGEKKLIAHLRALQVGVSRGSDDAVRMVAEEVAENAYDFAPEDTGDLKDSIEAIRVKKGQWQVRADRFGKPEIAIFMEYGTSKMAPRPFMQPAVDIVVSTSTVGADIRATGGLMRRGMM